MEKDQIERRKELVLTRQEGTLTRTIVIDIVDDTAIHQGEAFILKWQFRLLGNFNTKLTELILAADYINQNLIKMAYPIEVQAYWSYRDVEGWYPRLKSKVLVLL